MNKQVIICVDDEIIVLDALREQLEREFRDDLLIEIAESGEEALEIYDEMTEEGYEIPLVIADFIMPQMKGDDLLAHVHEKNTETRKIMLTGQATIEGVSNAVNKANLYRYISKPWDKDDLVLTIREAIKSYNQSNTILAQNIELKDLNTNLEKKVEERTTELEEINRTKDKFFSIIAHDLKNPFNSLLGFSELLLANLDDLGKDKIKEYISIIFESSQSSYALLENLLEWSRSQTGRLKIFKEKVDVFKIISENIRLLESTSNKKGVLLHNDVYPGTFCNADYNMVNTVVRNLLSNAVKFTNESDDITVDCEQTGKMLKVSVTDTGTGMKPEHLEKLFKIDQNVSLRGTADEGGTGLGLILCKEFIERNSGEIWVESELDKGSAFYFTLPIASAE